MCPEANNIIECFLYHARYYKNIRRLSSGIVLAGERKTYRMTRMERGLLLPHRKCEQNVSFFKHIIFRGIKLDISKDDEDGKFCNSIAFTNDKRLIMIDNIALVSQESFFICREMIYTNYPNCSSILVKFCSFSKKPILISVKDVTVQKFLFMPSVDDLRPSIIFSMPNMLELE